MSWSDKPAGAPYGALELKVTYQRNLLWGNAVALLLATAALGVVYLLNLSGDAVSIVLDDTSTSRDSIIVEILPLPPEIIRDLEIKPAEPSQKPTDIVSPKPVIVADSLLAGMKDSQFPTQIEKREINRIIYPDFPGEGQGNVLVIKDTTEDWPEVEEFVACERYPELLSSPQPEYPRIAKTTQTEGEVTVHVLVDEKGEPLDVRIYKESGKNVGFEEAAVRAAWNCRFSPGIQNGRPVKVWVVFKIEFTLENNY